MRANYNKGWTPNWGARGIAMANQVEKMPVSKPKNLETEDRSYINKLRSLLLIFPENDFYKGLAKQLVRNTALTTKQVGCIASDFDKFILPQSAFD